MIYYADFHALMTYGMLFWIKSSHSIEVFGLQKKIISIMMGARSKDSCGEFFKILGILSLTAQYIYSITMLIVTNKEYFMENSTLYDIKTRNNKNLFQPHLNLYIKLMLASRCIIIFLFQ